MSNGNRTSIINGKRVVIPDGITVDGMRQIQPSLGSDRFVIDDPTVGTKLLDGQEQLQPDQRYWTIPQIIKG